MKNLLYCFLVALLLPLSLLSQHISNEEMRQVNYEVINDPYIAVERANMPKGPAYHASGINYYTRQVNIDAAGNNILNDAANEPSLAVDPTNSDRIVVGWRQFDDIGSDFRQAGYGYTTDAVHFTFPGVLDPGNFRSDPVLDFDKDGNFYYNSLQSGFPCDVWAIEDGGVVWSPPVPANGGDKQWMRIDRSNSIGAGNNYSYWSSNFTTCANDGNFTRSTDTANSFEDCVLVDGDPAWGTLAVDRNGDLYVVGFINATSFAVVKSTTAKDAFSTPVTFDSVTMVDLDGNPSFFEPINPSGLLGQSWVDVDISNGPGQDNVYVLSTVARISNSDPADVMFARSTDGGSTFEPAVRINTDTGTTNYQWFGTMAVAPNGRIDVIWLDTRDNPGTFLSRLYYSFSEDQGTTWSPNTPISEAFDPNIGYPVQQKMGDYFDMKSDNDFAHVAWCGTFTGGQDVYYSRISPEGILNSNDITETNGALTVVPNPFSDQTTISFTLKREANTTVEVYDVLGRKVLVVLDEVVSGRQNLSWKGTNAQGAKLASGIYFIRLKSEGTTQTVQAVLR